MPELLYLIPDTLVASAYGCGSYGAQSYNNSCSTPSNNNSSNSNSSSGSSSSNSGNNPSSVTASLQVLQVDTGTPFVSSSSVETVSTHPVISGTAPPNSKVVVTIHSNPVTCSTTADSQGNWKCVFSQSINLGLHDVYIVATTPQGQVLNFPPFKIRAVKTTATTTTQPPKPAPSTHGLSTTAWAGIILAGIVFVILVAWLIIGIVRRRKNKQPPTDSGSTIIPSSPTGLN